MPKNKIRVLVTGGAGYIGSLLTKLLLDEGYAVTVLDVFMHRQNSLMDCCAHPDFEVVRGDCRDEDLVRKALKDKDVIIPLAALVGAPLCDKDKIAAETTNVGAIKLICKLASKEQRILYPVSNSGYGVGEKGKFCTEESPLKPITLYGRTKVEGEKAILDRGNAITFRLATAFGASPRMRMDLLVNDFVYRAVTDRAVVLFEGHFKRNYAHVRDIGRVFLHGIQNFEAMKDKPYNVGLDDANLSKQELCDVIKRFVPAFVYLEAPIGEDPDKRDYIVSNARLAKAGFKPKYSLEDGISELIKAYAVIRGQQYGNA